MKFGYRGVAIGLYGLDYIEQFSCAVLRIDRYDYSSVSDFAYTQLLINII